MSIPRWYSGDRSAAAWAELYAFWGVPPGTVGAPARMPSDIQVDYDDERRDGWALGEREVHAP